MRYSQQSISEEDIAAVVDVLRSPWLTQGPVVERFEAALAEYVGAKYAVAVSSGTAALYMCYHAMNAQRVTTSPLTFVATANSAVAQGCNIGFTDVDRDTGNADIRPEPHRPTSWIYVPVHFAGRAAPIPVGKDWSGFNVAVVEDACHALGATDFDGCSKVGSCAHSYATVFSFHPVKPITTGEGGAITTNDFQFAEWLRKIRSHGRGSDGLMRTMGLNFRMSELSAALGLSQLARCDESRKKRQYLYNTYDGLFANFHLGERIFVPAHVRKPPPYSSHPMLPGPRTYESACHLYTLRIEKGRDEVKQKLNAAGIEAQVHYSPIVPLQPYYRDKYGFKEGQFPEAEAWAAEELSLPLHAGMTEADVRLVVEELRRALR